MTRRDDLTDAITEASRQKRGTPPVQMTRQTPLIQRYVTIQPHRHDSLPIWAIITQASLV